MILTKKTFAIAILGLMAVQSIGIQQTHAAAIVTDDGTGKTAPEKYMLGFDFVVGASNQTVSALGIWDDSADDTPNGTASATPVPDGLIVAHQVGLWLPDGTLLGSVVVPAGTGSTLIGEFRYVDLVSPITLLAGATYTLGAEYYANTAGFTGGVGSDGPDLWHYSQTENNAGPAVFAFAPEFGSPYGRVGTEGTFTRPTGNNGAGVAYIGPNALFAIPVPEPGSASLLLLGSCSIVAARRLSKNRRGR